jgi:hypothetical protein
MCTPRRHWSPLSIGEALGVVRVLCVVEADCSERIVHGLDDEVARRGADVEPVASPPDLRIAGVITTQR